MFKKVLLILFLVMCLSGCMPHRIDTTKVNEFELTMVNRSLTNLGNTQRLKQKIELAKVVYSKELDELYQANISQLIEKIYNYNYQNFDRSNFIKSCKFCEFNLFCSNVKDKNVEFAAEIDFDTIDEFM